MANRVDDDLVPDDFVEDQEWIRRRRHTTNSRVVRAGPNFGMYQKQIKDVLNPAMNAIGPLGRCCGNMFEDGLKVG